MTLKQWQQQMLNDCLLEIGPSEVTLEYTKYGYLEFRDAGRVRNVTVITDLATKLQDALGSDNATFHLIHGQHVQTGDVTSMLVAVGMEGTPVYAADIAGRGSGDAVQQTERMRKSGKRFQFAAVAVGLMGIPLLMVFIGIPIIGGAIMMWRSGKKMSASAEYQLDFFEQISSTMARIPGAKLV